MHVSRQHHPISALCTAVAITLLLHPTHTYAIDKCTVNGQVTYTDRSCPADATVEPFTQPVSPPDDPAAARQRYLSDKKTLNQLNLEKARDEKQQQRQVEAAARHDKAVKNHELTCKGLDIKKQMANQQYANAKLKGNSKQTKKAQLQIQQAENNFAKACQLD